MKHVLVKAVGLIILSYDNNRILFLLDYFFVLNCKRNLVSVSCLIEHDLIVQFNFDLPEIFMLFSYLCL